MKKASRIAAILMSVAMVVTSCGNKAGDTSNAGGGAAGGKKEKIVVATANETPSLSPTEHNAVAGDYVNRLTYNGLMKLDKEMNPVVDLAKEYKVEKDANGADTIWIFTLNDAKFHDGSTLKADDVVASLTKAQTEPQVATYTKSYKTVEKVDDKTVKITTEKPSATLLYDLAHHANQIVPKALLDKGHDFNSNPVGTGPYKFIKWNRGESIEFEAFADYFDKANAPKIKSLIWKVIPEGSSRTLALQSGEVDYVIELDANSVTTLGQDPNVTVLNSPGLAHNWLGINNNQKPFDDINVRKALNAGINKENVVKVAFGGNSAVAKSQAPTGMLGEYTGDYDSYDVAKAKEYLKAWGGDPATIKLDIICSNDTKKRAAEVIQANLKDLGINVTITSMDLATYLSKTSTDDFTGFIGGFTANEMMSFLKGVYHSSNVGGSNKTRVKIPELDKMIEDAQVTVDKAAREKILQDTVKYLNQNCFQVPLWQENILSAHKKSLKNVTVTPGGSFYVNEWSFE